MTILDRARGRLRAARARHPALDHAARANSRYNEVRGSQVAGAVTYFGFLSFFPLLALAYAAVGYISVWLPDAEQAITDAVNDAFPSLIGSGPEQIDIGEVESARAAAGVIGVLGLLYAGLGWLDALRIGMRRVFGTLDEPLSFLRAKLVDLFVLLLLGVTLIASVVVSSLATSATRYALDTVGLADSQLATLLLKVLAIALAVVLDTVVFAILLSRLPGAQLPWRWVRSGDLLAAVGFEVLKLFGTFLIARTTQNPVYATFGVVVGMLVWMNFASRLLVYAAAWTATESRAPEPVGYDSVPVGVEAGSGDRGASRSTLTVRGVLVGAALGAGLAGALTRRGSRD
jgi:membrane protein